MGDTGLCKMASDDSLNSGACIVLEDILGDDQIYMVKPTATRTVVYKNSSCQADFDVKGGVSLPVIFCGLFSPQNDASTQCDIPVKVCDDGVPVCKIVEVKSEALDSRIVQDSQIRGQVPEVVVNKKMSHLKMSPDGTLNRSPVAVIGKRRFRVYGPYVKKGTVLHPLPSQEKQSGSGTIKRRKILPGIGTLADVNFSPKTVKTENSLGKCDSGSANPRNTGLKQLKSKPLHKADMVKTVVCKLPKTSGCRKRWKKDGEQILKELLIKKEKPETVIRESDCPIDDVTPVTVIQESDCPTDDVTPVTVIQESDCPTDDVTPVTVIQESDCPTDDVTPVTVIQESDCPTDDVTPVTVIQERDFPTDEVIPVTVIQESDCPTDDVMSVTVIQESDCPTDDGQKPTKNTKKKIIKNCTCRHCNLIFDTRLLLKQHLKSEHSDFKCTTCGFVTAKRVRLNRHLQKHSEEIAGMCDTCGKQFKYKHNMMAHISKAHSTSVLCKEFPFSCEHCQRQYTREKNFLKHGQDCGPCEVCGVSLKCKGQWALHRFTHFYNRPKEKAKALQCNLCPKKFSFPHHLRHHMETVHSEGIHEFKCDECGFCTKAKLNLQIHKKYHHGKPRRLHTCTVCEKSFGSNARLVEHTRIHTGERPFSCSACAQTFYSTSNLYAHERSVHKRLTNYGLEYTKYQERYIKNKISVYVCHICNVTLPSRRKLDSHLSQEHSMCI